MTVTPEELDELAAELAIVAANALRYRLGIRRDDLAAFERKKEQQRRSAPRHRTVRELRQRLRFCEPCGRSWAETIGRLCPSCGRLGGTA